MNIANAKKDHLAELLREVTAANLGQPVRISTSNDEPVGLFIPHYVSSKTAPPPRTPEQEAEFERRLANIDDAVSPEEMIELLKKDLRSQVREP